MHSSAGAMRKHGWAALAAMMLVLAWVAGAQAALIAFQPQAWNTQATHIERDGQPIVEPAPDILPGFPSFFWVQETNEKKAVAFSGAAAENPQIYQHVYAYSQLGSGTIYTALNETGYTRTFKLTPEELGNPKRKQVRLLSDVILDGLLLFVKDQEGTDGFKDLQAKFEVLITRENGKKLFKGAVALFTKKNGQVGIKTSGGIKARHISGITETDGMFRVDLTGVHIPYSTKVRVGQEFQLITQVFSSAGNRGQGTGTEVLFGPGAPVLPDLQQVPPPIPEPTTLALLGTGAAMLFYLPRRHGRVA